MTRNEGMRLTLVFFLLALVLLVAAAHQNRSLVRLRMVEHAERVESLENASPLVSFTTVVLGGFRGLLADMLWLRASRLQDEGRYFELVQLADWITKLEPRLPEVWAYHAWNLGYNISVLMTEPEERWRWIRNALHLLRDKGLRYNPGDPQICLELARLFAYKIGGMTDEAHAWYKLKWREEMSELLGGAAPDYDAIVANSEKLRRMRSEYQLDPVLMKEIDEKYGPLDWRLAQSHAVYWGYVGRRKAKGIARLTCHRVIYQSLANLLQFGKLEFHPEEGRYVFGPNLRFLPHALAAYEFALSEVNDESVRVSYGNFLRQAVYLTHRLGRPDLSHNLFETLRLRFPAEDTAGGYEVFIAGRKTWEEAGR